MYHLEGGVKATLIPTLGWSRTEAEELPVLCRQEELIPGSLPAPLPMEVSRQPRTVSLLELPLGLTLQNWPFIIFDTGAISESTALAHSGIIISKLGLCFASEGGHADNNNASRVFFLYCNATCALDVSPGSPLKPSRVGCQGCLPSETAWMQMAGKK